MSETMEDEAAVAVDYETFYDTKAGYSLAKMPTWQYCADPRFDAYLVAICGWNIFGSLTRPEPGPEDGSYEWRSVDGSIRRELPDGRQVYVGRPENFDRWAFLKGRLCLAHNASFDQVVTVELAKRGKIPSFMGEQRWACTADLSTYLMAPRNLKGAMKALFGKEISKEVRAGMDGRHEWQLDERERDDLYEYGGSDAVECHDLWLKYSKDWPYVERRVSELNRLSTMRGIKLDMDYVRRSVKELESYLAVVACDIPWYPEKALGSLPALKAAVIAMGLTCPKSFKKDDPGFLRWQDQNGNVPFVKARQKAISISMCLARVKSMLETADGEDRSHPAFLYFGSHTGRFSGKSESGGNQNLLNLQRKPVMSGDEHVFGGKGVDIRGMYISDSGRSFYVADYAQIEARMSLWLVNDTHMMEAMKREGNLYQAASVMMGWSKSGDPIKKTNPELYRLSKAATLGLGYGLGAVKFVDNCKSQGLELPPVPVEEWGKYDVDGRRVNFILRNVARIKGDPRSPRNQALVGQILSSLRIVDDWRRANHLVVEKWRALESAFKQRAAEGKPTVAFRLPSGRVKRYWNPQLAKEPTVEVGEDGREHPSYRVAMRASTTIGGTPVYFTGGSLLENIIQATARDLLMAAIVEICDRHPGWRYVWNVYDECIIDVPDEEVPLAEAEIPKLMTGGDHIRWADGLMLEVEGGACKKYHK